MENNTPYIYSNEKNQSDTIGELAKSLCNAQSNMGKAMKSSDNPFFKSKYADISACLEASLPALNKEGISIVQGSDYDPTTKTFFVECTLLHTSGEWIKSKLFVPITKMDAQGVGAAQTYGRRYLLSAMVGLAQEDDDGNSISLNRLEKGKKAGESFPENLGARALADSNASPEPKVAQSGPQTFEESPDLTFKQVLKSIIPCGGSKGKTYKEIYSNNPDELLKAGKRFSGLKNPSKEQTEHLENLRLMVRHSRKNNTGVLA